MEQAGTCHLNSVHVYFNLSPFSLKRPEWLLGCKSSREAGGASSSNCPSWAGGGTSHHHPGLGCHSSLASCPDLVL